MAPDSRHCVVDVVVWNSVELAVGIRTGVLQKIPTVLSRITTSSDKDKTGLLTAAQLDILFFTHTATSKVRILILIMAGPSWNYVLKFIITGAASVPVPF